MKYIALALFLFGVTLMCRAFVSDPYASFDGGTFIWMLFKFLVGAASCVVAVVLFAIAIFTAI